MPPRTMPFRSPQGRKDFTARLRWNRCQESGGEGGEEDDQEGEIGPSEFDHQAHHDPGRVLGFGGQNGN